MLKFSGYNAPFVTGGAGFIGSHLCDALIAQSINRLSALDSLNYGTWENILAQSFVNTIMADMANLSADDMVRMIQGHDILFHFAAEKHNNAIDSPQRVIDVNISATARLFDAAGRAGVKKIIFASSLYSYGRLRGPAMRETDVPEPRTVYGVSKLAGEGLLREAAFRYGMDHLSLRLFFVYGPRQYARMGYPSVIVRNFARLLNGEPPVIFGDGEQIFDYVCVHDVIRAVLAAASSSGSGEVFNIGTGIGTSINKLTALMLAVAKSSATPIHAEADWTAGTCRVADPTAIKASLGWSPQVPMTQALHEIWTWMHRSAALTSVKESPD